MKKIWLDEDTSILLLKFIHINTNVQNCLCFSILYQCVLHCKNLVRILINLSYLIFITSPVNFYYATFYDYISYYIVICAYCMLFIVA